MQKPKIIYVFDALCGWCYGFSPVIKAVNENYCDQFNFEVLSGGMMLGEKEGRIGLIAPYIKSAYKQVEETTGIVFGEPFLHELDKGQLYFGSEFPAIGLAVLKSHLPDQAVHLAHELQNCIYFDGKGPSDPEVYRFIAVNHGVDPDLVEKQLQEESFKQAAYYEFALSRQLQVSGYPAAFIQTTDSKFYMIARGYADYETMELRINNVLKEIKA